MPILETLAKDHRTLETMLAKLGDTASSKSGARIEQFSDLQTLLQAHARAEEEVVYRRLSLHAPDELKTLEAFEEHHVADILLQELASACPGGRAWGVKVKVLEEVLRMHIKAEELNVFALVNETFDASTRLLMDREFHVLKHERLEAFLGPLRRATPAFAGRAAITAQAAAGRYVRRGELYVRRALLQLRA